MNNFTKAFYTKKSKLTSLVLLTFFALMLLGSEQGFAQQTAVYTVATTTTATQSGTKPTGAGHSYSQTFGTVSQMTSGNSSTLTLTGYAGYRITSIVLNMRSNTSSGAGSMNVVAGSTNIFSIPTATAFSNAAWNGAYSTSYVNLSAKTPTAYNITTGQNVVITILASANSLYIGSYSITYVPSGPSLTTPTVGSINNDGATLGATVSSDGGASLTSRGTVWGTATAPTGNVLAEGGTAVSAFTHARTGMGPNVLIYYRGYAINANGTGYSPESTFYTLANQASAPTVSNPTDTTLDVAITSGDGNPAITTYAIQDVASGNYVPLAGGALSATPVYQTAAAWGTKTVTGLSNGTTYNFRAIARNGDLTLSTASSNGSGTTTTPSGTITTTPASYGPFCNNSSNGISVAYSTTGTLTGTFYAQISDASGNFTNGVFTGATIIGSGASPISATIPSGLAAGTGYKVRVINDTPATYGTDNGTAFTISAPPAITSGTLADASTNVGVATTFGVTATNAASYEWYVDTGSGFTGPIVNGTSGGVTYSNATTNILSVNPSSTAANGYKYKVTVNGNSPCGSVDSTPSGGATLSVSVAPVVIYQNPFESGTLSSPTYTGGTTTLAANLSSSVWTIGSGTLQFFGGSSGNALGVSAGATSSPYTLTFTVAPGYQLSVSSYSFWKQTSNSALVNSVTINGITVSSGPATSATGNTGTLTVANAVSGLTGTITVVLNITGTGSFRLDDFTLSGNVSLTVGSNLAAYASQPSSDIASGSTNVPLAGFSVTPTPSADFTSVTVTGVSSSPSDITNVRIFRDNNGNGVIDGADASVSGAGIAFANGNLSAMTISGETGFSGARNYLIVADISASPSSTSVGVSIGSGNFVTSLASNTGSMAVNTRTLIVPTSTLAAYGTFTGNITKGTTDALLAGFSVTPSESANFTSVTLTGVSTAPGDITSVRIFRDNNGNGLIDGADASVSGAGVAFANGNLSPISISGETGFSSIRYYIVVANVSGTATSSSVGVSIGSGNFATTLAEAGSMATNTRTLVNSALSNIIRSTGFTEPTNLAYGTYQTTNITAAGAGVGNIKIAEFTIQDGGGSNDGDGLGTILNSLTFTVSNFANVRRLALVDGATVVSDVAVSSSSATFSSLTLTAADNGSKTFSVYASFNTTVTDNQNIGLTVSAATPSPSGSGFAVGNAGAAASVVTGNTNKIVVTATKLLFGTVSGSTFNVNLPAFTVSTTDANNNRDTDINALSVTLGTDGTGATLSNPHTITAGTVSISTVQFSNPQSGIKLTAAASGYTTVDSNTFTISSFAEGTWRTLTAGAWHATVDPTGVAVLATFERIVSGTWVAQGFYSTGNLKAIQPPASGNTNQVIIAHSVTLIGNNTHKNIVIESGGTLDTAGVGTTFGSLLVKTGGTFNRVGNGVGFDASPTGILEVEDGAFFNFSHTNTSSRSSSIWNGTEKFHKNSTTTILLMNNSAQTLFENPTDISEYTDGSSTACFGNLVINMTGAGILQLLPDGFSNLGGTPKQLTHQDLILRDNGNTQALCAGSFNVVIGRDLITESTYGVNATFAPTSGAFTGALTVKGNFVHSAPRTFTIANNSNAGSTMAFNVLGDMTINPATTGTLNINGNVNTVTTVNLSGDLSVTSAGLLSAASGTVSANKFNFVGNGVAVPANIQTINVASAGAATTENYRIAFDVNAGASVVLATNDLQLGTSSTFNVASGAVLDFGFDGSTALNVTNVASATGTSFTLTGGGTLKITSPGGIMASAASGNVLTNSRTFNQGGSTFHYMGKVNQNTGDVYTSGVTAKKIICDLDTNALTLTLDVPTGTSNELYIKKGIFVDTDTNKISGSAGALTIDADGTFRSGVLTATGNVPLLGGAKTYADGSTIELNAPSGGQRLEGGVGTPQYKNLIFSNGGTKITTAHSFDIKGTVTVQTGTTLDVDNNSFGGSETNLTLNGTGIYKVSGSGTKPDADGTYNLAATSTVEFYGSSATVVKLGSPAVSYGNVVVSGTNVSSTSATTGILFKSGGSFTVKQGATFTFRQPGGLNGLVNSAVSSTNNPTVTIENTPSLSTIVYNGASQSLTGRADYGNLIINNTSGALTTSGDVTVSGTLTLTQGIITTGANTIIVTNDTTPISGGSAVAYVNGKLRITYPATGTNVARTFPIGKGGAYRPLVFTYDSAPASRTVLVEQFETAFPTALPSTAASLFGTRYWNITQSSIGASYQVTLNTPTPSSTATIAMIRREGSGVSTANDTTTPTYTNSISFSTTNVSNDVALGICTLCTQIRSTQCGATLRFIDTIIEANAVSGATAYRFEIIRTDNPADSRIVVTGATPRFKPTNAAQLPGGLIFGKSYNIRVQAFVGGTWNPYGNTCVVTAPNEPPVLPTYLNSNFCGKVLADINASIECQVVYQATAYEFEVRAGAGNGGFTTKSFVSPTYYFGFYSGIAGVQYNKAYIVRVRAFSQGSWTPWGPDCTIYTPDVPQTFLLSTNNSVSGCSRLVNSIDPLLGAYEVRLAERYKFRVKFGVNTVEVEKIGSRYFSANDFKTAYAPGYQYSTVYTIDVDVMYDGQWRNNWGPLCTITTPAPPIARMAAQDINTNVFEVSAFPNPFARHFSLDIQSSSDDLVEVKVYDMIGRTLEVQNATVSELSTKEIGTNYPSGVYNVVVSQGDKVRSIRMIKR